MPGERRYIGIGEETSFGTEQTSLEYLDFASAQLDVPDNPGITFEGAGGGRGLRIYEPGPYAPSGSIEVPVDMERIGWFLKSLFGQVDTTGTGPYLHTFDVKGSRTPDAYYTIVVGKELLEQAFLGCAVSQIQFQVDREFLMATVDIVAQKDQNNSLDTASKDFPTSYATFRHHTLALDEDLSIEIAETVDTDITQYVESFSMTINNNIDAASNVRHGSIFPREILYGGMDVSGSVTVAFRNLDEYERFWGASGGPEESGATQFVISSRFQVGSDTFELFANKARWTNVSAPVQGRDRMTQTLSFQSLWSDDSGKGPAQAFLSNSKESY